jgi:hypothetical protein
MRHPDIIKIFCLTHRANFPVLLSEAPIVCAEGEQEHLLSNQFPNEGNWLYCCNCRNFRLIAPDQNGREVTQCPACGCGENARLYTCDQCNVTMVDFDDCTRQKSYNLLAWGMPQPDCPGCRSFPLAAPQLHECRAVQRIVASARATCFFCAETTAPPNPETNFQFTDYVSTNGNAAPSTQTPSTSGLPESPSGAPISLAQPAVNGKAYKRNGTHEHSPPKSSEQRSTKTPLVNAKAAPPGKSNGKSNGLADESKGQAKPAESARVLQAITAQREAAEALAQEAEAKLRAAEERTREMERREAELRERAAEQGRLAAAREAELRQRLEEQAQIVTARETGSVNQPTPLRALERALELKTPAQSTALLSNPASTTADLDRQLEEEWARIEFEMKQAQLERQDRYTNGVRRTLVPPNRTAPQLNKAREKSATKTFPQAVKERSGKAQPEHEPSSRSLLSQPKTGAARDLEAGVERERPDSQNKGAANQHYKLRNAPLTAQPAPTQIENTAGLQGAAEFAGMDQLALYNHSYSVELAEQPLPSLQLDFGESSAFRRNLLIGYIVITILLLALLFGLGSFGYYLFNQ